MKNKTKPFICPVCGKHNFTTEGDFEFCPICKWQNDGFYESGGANDLSLEDYRKQFFSKNDIWPYDVPNKLLFESVIRKIAKFCEKCGAEYVGKRKQNVTTLVNNKTIIEEVEYDVYKFNNEFFVIDSMCFPEKPFIVLSFGDTLETAGDMDDAEPFPYDLSDDELMNEVRYSLLIEPYPKSYPKK